MLKFWPFGGSSAQSAHTYAEKGKVKDLEKLLKEQPDVVNSKGQNDMTPLHLAAKCNKLEVIELLLNHKADVKLTDQDGDTSLHYAAFNGNNACLQRLLKVRLAPTNARNKNGVTPLIAACEQKKTDCVKSLLESGAAIFIRNKDGKDALAIAREKKDTEIENILLGQQVLDTQKNRSGNLLGPSGRMSELPSGFEDMPGFRDWNSNLKVEATIHKSSSASSLAEEQHTDPFTDPFFNAFESSEFHMRRLSRPEFSTGGFQNSWETKKMTKVSSFPDFKPSFSATLLGQDDLGSIPENDHPPKEKSAGKPITPKIQKKKTGAPKILISEQPGDASDALQYVKKERQEIEEQQGAQPSKKSAVPSRDAEEPPQVFLSYQWDHQEHVWTLYRSLTSLGFSCWMDIFQIKPGDDLQVRMQEGIRQCQVVLCFLTHKYLRSKNCEHEVSFADEFRKPIIPIRLAPVERSDFPDGIFRAAIPHRIIYIDLIFMTKSKELIRDKEEFIKLVESMKKHTQPKEKAKRGPSESRLAENCFVDSEDVTYIMEKDGKSRITLGSGGCANVFKGHYEKLSVDCAVKLFHSGSRVPDEVRRLVESEARKMMSIRSKHVVEIYGVLMNDVAMEYGIIMEYFPYGSMLDFMNKVNIPVPLKVQIARDIAFGMTFLHKSCQLIHRDLKAQNILLDDRFSPKITDLGQARFDNATSTISKKQMEGSVAHMSPEDLDPPDDYEPTTYTDIWAYGITLFELCADKNADAPSPMRRLPFSDQLKPNQIIALVGVKKTCPITDKQISEKLCADCPPELIDLMKKCCQVDPTSRPTFPDVLEILQQAMVAKYQSNICQDMSYLRKQYDAKKQ